MNKYLKRLWLVALACMAGAQAYSQSTFSPYSVLGLGELVPVGNIRTVGMGGFGVAAPSLLYGSQQNAAWLPFNQYTMFDGNFITEYKRSFSGSTQADDLSGNLYSLQLSFPVMRGRYGMGVGIRPVSLVNYSLNTEEKLPNTPAFVRYNYRGSGGVSQVYWSHGLRVNKWLYFGLEAQYSFGSVTNESRSLLIDNVSLYIVDIQEQTSFSSISASPSVGISLKIDSLHVLNIGAVYRGQRDMGVNYDRQFQRRQRSDATIDVDTITSTTGTVRMPQGLAAGVSFEKRFNYTFGADVALDNWGSYRNTIRPQNLVDAVRVSVGGEWTPNFASVGSYFKRVTYRAGARIENTPWSVNDVQIKDIGLNFGLSLPVYRGISSMNWAFTFGQRGTTDGGLIKEKYFRIGVGLVINDTQWFIRRKIY